jgi:hypothetical protein
MWKAIYPPREDFHERKWQREVKRETGGGDGRANQIKIQTQTKGTSIGAISSSIKCPHLIILRKLIRPPSEYLFYKILPTSPLCDSISRDANLS